MDRTSALARILELEPDAPVRALELMPDDEFGRYYWACVIRANKARKKRRATKLYQARCMLAGKRVSLGYFTSAEEARQAVETAKFAHSIGLPYTAQ
jgi:hypothetical protein